MATTTPIHYLGLLEVADLLRRGEVTSVQLTTSLLERIDTVDARLGSYVEVLRDRALAEAAEADAARARGVDGGPLLGVPVAVKDMFCIEGEPMAAGMAIRRDFRAPSDATVIERLRQAGAVLLGTLKLPEAVYAEHRDPFPAPLNPWDADIWSGASSSGSGVAVAAGLCFGSIGSEAGGSLRLPAAANGVTTLKPTWGRVSRHGAFELAATLDHVGPMARSAADAAALLAAIAGPDPRDPTAVAEPVPDLRSIVDRGVEGLRIGVDPVYTTTGVAPGMRAVLDDAVATLVAAGAEVREVRVPDVSEMVWDWFPVCAVQTAIAHEATFPARADEYGPALRQLLELGHRVTAVELDRLERRRREFTQRLAAVFEDVDVLAMPVLEFDTPPVSRWDDLNDDFIAALHRFTAPFNMSGSPAIAMPGGFSEHGLPRTFQLVGRHFEEEALLSAGHAYQAATDWHRLHPAV